MVLMELLLCLELKCNPFFMYYYAIILTELHPIVSRDSLCFFASTGRTLCTLPQSELSAEKCQNETAAPYSVAGNTTRSCGVILQPSAARALKQYKLLILLLILLYRYIPSMDSYFPFVVHRFKNNNKITKSVRLESVELQYCCCIA